MEDLATVVHVSVVAVFPADARERVDDIGPDERRAAR